VGSLVFGKLLRSQGVNHEAIESMDHVDVIIVGGGQSGLAIGYFLRRTGLSFLILDAEPKPGGAWQHTWDSLRLFSPAQWSSLPGWPMPRDVAGDYPDKSHVLRYLAAYEERYALPVRRPVFVQSVERAGERLAVRADTGVYEARAVVSATGTWRHPYTPHYPGASDFKGVQMHSAQYKNAAEFSGKRVLVIGGGNSGAQILAEVSLVADTVWATKEPPLFLPDSVDGRVLFERATERWKARVEGREANDIPGGLGDIVMIPTVRHARERGVLVAVNMPEGMTPSGAVWAGGREEHFDAIIWCTGYRPALRHLEALGVVQADGRVAVDETRSQVEPRLWLVGYGEWTGFASATLIGIMRSARATAQEIGAALAVSD